MTEHPGLKTPGGLIRAARNERGMSVAELSERTKIPPPVLEALEGDEYHKVSGALYIKSFLRTCAAELGLDTEEVIGLYGGMTGSESSPAGGPDMVWQEDEVQISRVGLPWRLFGLTGLALVLVGAGLLVLMRGCGGSGDETAVGGNRPAAPELTSSANEDSATATLVPPPVERPVSGAVARNVGQDTLAGAWMQAKDPAPAPAKTSASTTISAPAKTSVGGDQSQPASSRPTAPPPTTRTAPLPVVGGPNLVFAGGISKPVVLRVICERPREVEVKLDAADAFSQVRWPDPLTASPALPATGIEPGRVYLSSRGLVVYWGADDHLSLRLERTDGIEVALNGKVRNIRNLRPGAELLLDAHGD